MNEVKKQIAEALFKSNSGPGKSNDTGAGKQLRRG